MKKFLFLWLLFLARVAAAQYPGDHPYQSVTAVTPALPPLYGYVIDSTVPEPVRLTRITDYVAGWDWYPHHEYAKIQPWNADGSLYKFYSVALYDDATHRMIRELPGGEIWPSYWSNTDPNLIYSFRQNGDVKVYDVAADTVRLTGHIYAVDSTQTNYDIVALGPGEGNIDRYDHYVALVGKHGADLDVIIYDLQTGGVALRRRFPGAWGNGSNDFPQYVDWVSVSQSGDYVGIMWDHNNTSASQPFDGHYGVEIYDRANMQFLRRIADYGNHGDFGYDSNGEEVFVQFWGPTGTLNMYYLDRQQRVVLQTDPDFGRSGHISCRNLQRPGWAYVSQDDPADAHQMVAVKLDGSGTVEFFGHHFSTAANYLKSPMPVPSPDGTRVMFKSDFGDTDPDVVYTFVARAEQAFPVGKQNVDGLRLYPNPAGGEVHIVARKTVRLVRILTSGGRETARYAIHGKRMRISTVHLHRGVYWVRILFDDGTSATYPLVVAGRSVH